MERSSETILVILVIIALVLTAVNAFIALRQVADIARVTGFVIDSSGRVNLSIPSQAAIRFNVSIIDWENGTVNTLAGFQSANLSTSAPVGSKVVQGTWSETNPLIPGGRKLGIDTGLLIMNIGNVNLSLQIRSSAAANAYLCGVPPCGAGTIPDPQFRWNVTENETGACGGADNINSSVRGIYSDVVTTDTFICGNASTGGYCSATGCKLFRYGPPRTDDAATDPNTIRVDFFIEVPRDAVPGGRSATITMTGTE